MKRLCLALALAFPFCANAYILIPADTPLISSDVPSISNQSVLNLPAAASVWSATPVYETMIIPLPNAYQLMKPKEPSGGIATGQYQSANKAWLGQFTLYDNYQGFDIVASVFQNNAGQTAQAGKGNSPIQNTAFKRYGIDLHMGYVASQMPDIYSMLNVQYRDNRQMSFEDQYSLGNVQFIWNKSEDTAMSLKAAFNRRQSLGKIYVRKDGIRFISDDPTPGTYSSTQIERAKIIHRGLFYGIDHKINHTRIYFMAEAKSSTSQILQTKNIYNPESEKVDIDQTVTRGASWLNISQFFDRHLVLTGGLKVDFYQLSRYKNILLPGQTKSISISSNTLVKNVRFLPNVSIYFVPSNLLSLRLSYTQNRRAPSEEERFVPGPFPVSAADGSIYDINQDLKPEESKNLSFALNYQQAFQDDLLEVNFNSRFSWVHNYIAIIKSGNTAMFQNIDKVRLNATSLDVRYSTHKWLLGAGASYFWGNQYLGDKNQTVSAPLQPIDAPVLSVRGQYTLIPNMLIVGTKVEHYFTTRVPKGLSKPKGYTVASLYGYLDINQGTFSGLKVQAVINNLFNSTYKPAFYSDNQPGINFQLNVSYHF